MQWNAEKAEDADKVGFINRVRVKPKKVFVFDFTMKKRFQGFKICCYPLIPPFPRSIAFD